MRKVNINERRANRRRREKRRRTMQIISRIAISLCMAGMIGIITYQSTIISKSEITKTAKIYHVVEINSGETLYEIANRYINRMEYETIDDYVAEIMLINNMNNPEKIIAGQNIIVPIYIEQ